MPVAGDGGTMLEGYRVLDLSGPLGWVAGRILADLGADVIKVESPDADLEEIDWRAFNVNKRLLRLDTKSVAGRQVVDRALAEVDVLIETAQPGIPADTWLEPARLTAINPGLVHVSVTPFGRHGPRAHWRGTDLEIMAASGAMSLIGEPGGVPLRMSVPQSHAWAGMHAACGAVLALFNRTSGGSGQHVDVSAQVALVTALAHAPTFVDILGTVPDRAGSAITGRSVHGANFRAFWKCRDGYLNFVVYGGPAGRRSNQALVEWMTEKGAALGALVDIDWIKFDPKLAQQGEIDRLEEPIAAFLEGVNKQEFLDEACTREILGYPVSTTADIAEDPQLEARGFWQYLPAPDGGSERHCGVFYMENGVRPEIRHAAGNGHADTHGVLSEFGFDAREISELRDGGIVAPA